MHNNKKYACSQQNYSQGQGRGSRVKNSTSSTPGYQHSNQTRVVVNNPSHSTEQRTLPHHQESGSQGCHFFSQSNETVRRKGQQDMVRLSKTLAYLLRYGAEKSGFHFIPGGYLYVDELLKHHNLRDFTETDIKALVTSNDKQRFALQNDDNGRLMIRDIESHRTVGQQDMVQLSKTLAYLLRHGAEKSGFYFMPGGYLYVDELLQYHKPLRGVTKMQIMELVTSNDKQRFALQKDDEGRLMIRANQGHSTAVEGLDLIPIQDASEVKMVVHGTYYQALDLIKNMGLSRMTRNHIHFAEGMPGESGVISGMRKSCEVVIEIDLKEALKAGILFFRSANNVILSPGNDSGIIPPNFFKSVIDRHSRKELIPRDLLRSNSSLPSVKVTTKTQHLQVPVKRKSNDLSEDEHKHKKKR